MRCLIGEDDLEVIAILEGDEKFELDGLLALALNLLADERLSTVGIMDVAAAVQYIEHLSGLGDGAEQGVVAALALLLAVEAHGGAFSKAARADHRAVEIQRQARRPQGGEALQHQPTQQALQRSNALGIGTGQAATDRGHIRQALQPHHAFHHRVIGIEAQVTTAKAQPLA